MYLVVPPGGCFPETRRVELGPGALTIGRAEACEIRVDVPGVDQEHAKISEVALVAIGADCAIGDVPLDPGARRLVMPGDEIQIGSVVVAVEGEDPSLIPPPPDQTTPRLGSPMAGPRVRVVEGAAFGDELLMHEEGREYLVGRGVGCDLVLDDREVSREHLRLVRRGYSVFIQDLSSTRGSWLGRAAVYAGATIEWSRPRMLRVGATVLSLEVPEAIRRAAKAAQTSAPMTPPPRAKNPVALPMPAFGGGAAGMLDLTPLTGMAPGIAPLIKAAADEPPHDVPVFQYVPVPDEALAAVSPSPNARGIVVPASTRKAWKKTGPTIGKGSGLLLLALAGIAILGALFMVFSLLE